MNQDRTLSYHDEGRSAQGDGPAPSVASRLRFIWFVVVATLWTVPMALYQTLSYQWSPTARNFKRNARAWGGVIFGLTGIRLHIDDRARLDHAKPYVFVSNHQNLLDILALSAGVPYPFGFVAKEELSRVPFLGLAIRNSACVTIDRSDPRSAISSLRLAGERIRSGHSVLVFAEGTRSYGRELQPLKKGAFALAVEAGVPMVIVTIVDAYQRMNERQRLLEGGAIRIVIDAPILLEGKTRRDIPALMEMTQERMKARLDDDEREDVID